MNLFKIYLRSRKQERLAEQRHAEILASINYARKQIMSELSDAQEAIDALEVNLTDMEDLSTQILGVVTKKDELAAALQKTIDDMIAAANIDAAAKTALRASAQSAFAKSAAVEDKFRALVPGVPPVGGTPLLPAYADRASFDAAVTAYTGPEGVTVDGAEVKAGTTPSLDYFSHSADGSVSISGPAD